MNGFTKENAFKVLELSRFMPAGEDTSRDLLVPLYCPRYRQSRTITCGRIKYLDCFTQ